MRIEKINDKQIRCTLNQNDLKLRSVNSHMEVPKQRLCSEI